MKIAMVASEAAPFVKTGGLGDVMQALPAELSKLRGNEIVLFLPYYKKVKENKDLSLEFMGSFTMDLAWRESYVGIYRLRTRRKRSSRWFRCLTRSKGSSQRCRRPCKRLGKCRSLRVPYRYYRFESLPRYQS